MPIFADYRLPPEMQAAAPSAAGSTVDGSWLALVVHWRLVVADLRKEAHIDLYAPDVLAGSWLPVRSAIFSLLDSPTRLRSVLTRR